MSIKTNVLVKDVMIDLVKTPKSSPRTLLKEALEVMDQNRLGIVCIVDADNILQGIITDGDIRRMLTRVQKPLAAMLGDDVIAHAVREPFTVGINAKLYEALDIMQQRQIWDLPVIDKDKLIGLLHLHPAIKSVLAD
jgi:arabinose-5-phosphate isomerase